MKYFLGVLALGAFLGTLAFFNFTPFRTVVQQVAFGSPVGTTFSTAKIAAMNIAPATASATSTSILNSDASDRYITSAFAECTGAGSSQTAYTGAGLANLLLRIATSSTAAPVVLSNTNYAANLTIATTAPATYQSTTTPTTSWMQVWASGSYLTFYPNATNTAQCVVGVSYLAS